MSIVGSRLDTSGPEEGWVENSSHAYVRVNGVRLHYVESGEGPLVLLLHGFPDFWYSWRRQIPALAAAGFRVVAPDLRGYNRSDQPRAVAAYAPEVLAGDIKGLIRALGEDSATVVGHDWGGGVAWYFAMWHPENLDKLAILNCPHPREMLRGFTNPAQLARSWYMFFFQLPLVPQVVLGARDHAALRSTYAKLSISKEAFTPLDIDRYIQAAERSDNFRGGINYYRAAMRRSPSRVKRDSTRIDGDVLVLWGDKDQALLPGLAQPSSRLVPRCDLRRFPHAGHWVHLDDPGAINEALVYFLGH